MLNQKTLIVLLSLVLGLFFLNSCEKATLVEDELSGEMSFSKDIKPIFNKSCVSCHVGSRKPELSVNPYKSLTDGKYYKVAQPTDSELYKQLKNSSTHSSKVSSTELQKILLWITQGAKNN